MTLYAPKKLTLPTERSIPETRLEAFSLLIYGKQGMGKTSFTAQFPNAIHMMFEPGAKTESIFQVFPKNWNEVEEYAKMIKDNDQFKNVVLDTLDLMWEMCCDQVCKDNGVDMLKDIGFGDGYAQAGNRFRNLLTILHSNKGLVMLSHEKERIDFANPNAPAYTIPSTGKRGAETVAKWVDLTAHYYLDNKGKHQLRIRTSTDREAKNRIKKRFLYTDGSQIVDIYMGNDEFEAYQNFSDAFENKTEKPSPSVSLGQTKTLTKPKITTTTTKKLTLK